MNDAQKYGLHRSGRPLPMIKSRTHGSLLMDGRPIEVNKPFAILGHIKAQKIKTGINKNRLKIVAMYKRA